MTDNQMDFIENTLYYSLYLAENDFVRQLAVIDNRSNYITESNYIVLNEALLDTIRQFIARVVKSITEAFNKFKATMVSEKAMQQALNLINNNQNLLTTDFRMLLPDNFEIPDVKEWNTLFDKVTNEVAEFDTKKYEEWNQASALDTPDTFIRHNFQSLTNMMLNNNNNLLEGMNKLVYGNTKNEKGATIASDKAQVFSQYITEYEKQTDTIKKQVDKLNVSIKNIDTHLSQISAAKESYLGLSGVLSILNEEESGNTSATTQAPTQNASQPAPTVDTSNTGNNKEFRDADNPNGEKKEDANKDKKYIVNFIQANSIVLSAEMKMCNRIRLSCIEIVSNFINIQLKKNGGNANNQQQQNNNNQNQQQNQQNNQQNQQQNQNAGGENVAQVDTGNK